jgi:hypothetical protein
LQLDEADYFLRHVLSPWVQTSFDALPIRFIHAFST